MTKTFLSLAILLLPNLFSLMAAERWNGQPGVLHLMPAPRGAMARLDDGSVGLFGGVNCTVWQPEQNQWGAPFSLRDSDGKSFSLKIDHNWVIRLSSGKLAAFV